MAEPHTGNITFLFTDVEGSTSLWERTPKAMSESLSRHDEILRTAIEAHNGHVFKTVGDAFHATFSAAPDALRAALEAQRALLRESWDLTGPLRVRMALHTGTAEERDGDYFGPSLNRVARLLSAGHGGQILLSLATRELVRDRLPDESGLRDLGERRLKDLSSPEHVFQVSASGLRSEFPPLKTLDVRRNNQPAKELLEGYLRDKQVLLVLDNFEQVLESAPLLDALILAAPGLKVLATSRTPLRLYGEHEFPVPPLSLPDTATLPHLESLTRYAAVRLFVDRARAIRPDFSLTEENAPAVIEICMRLDGLPLAIELAAARKKFLPPQAMLSRLENRLKLLTGGARNLPERQRTLRSTIEWSYELLDEGEKTLFARLAVFSGGSTLEAMEAVCDPQGDLPVDTLEGVSSLLDKSLLRREEGQGDEPRFVMLETIHEYASERLEEQRDAEAIKRAHAEYSLVL